MQELMTLDEVLEELGGTQGAAQLTGLHPNAVKNWRTYGHFPAKTYLVMIEELARRRKSAPRSLWGMLGA